MKLPFNKRNRITQPWSSAHYGLDIVGDDDKRVLCVEPGTVITSTIITNKNDRTWEWGNYVRVDGDDGKRYFYCHLASRAVKAGQRINKDDVIGIMGNTGKSFGAHLHLQVRTNQNSELNVAEVLGVPNLVGTYTEQTLSKPQLWLTTIGPVSVGDKVAFEALAGQIQVPCKIDKANCKVGLCRCNIGPVSGGDLLKIKELATTLKVACDEKEVR